MLHLAWCAHANKRTWANSAEWAVITQSNTGTHSNKNQPTLKMPSSCFYQPHTVMDACFPSQDQCAFTKGHFWWIPIDWKILYKTALTSSSGLVDSCFKASGLTMVIWKTWRSERSLGLCKVIQLTAIVTRYLAIVFLQLTHQSTYNKLYILEINSVKKQNRTKSFFDWTVWSIWKHRKSCHYWCFLLRFSKNQQGIPLTLGSWFICNVI